jgi:hypothetical protein
MFAKKAHQDTGCTYDEGPYDKHLNHVHDVFERYRHLILPFVMAEQKELRDYDPNGLYFGFSDMSDEDIAKSAEEDIEDAIWLHDTIEDCRVSYSKISRKFNQFVAEIVYAVTNELGKSRKESAEKTYPKIREAGASAIFVKLCDRIANVEASIEAAKNGKPSYIRMYCGEHEAFSSLRVRRAWESRGEYWTEMWQYLDKLIRTGAAWTES